jgi:hypothetical protein
VVTVYWNVGMVDPSVGLNPESAPSGLETSLEGFSTSIHLYTRQGKRGLCQSMILRAELEDDHVANVGSDILRGIDEPR